MDSNTKSDVLSLFLRAVDAVEMSKLDVASRVVVSRGPSAFKLPEKCAADALKELVFDGYLAVRRGRVNLYRRDPADARPTLPEGYQYERVRNSRGGVDDWIRTPRSGAHGRVSLYLEGNEWAASGSVFYDLTSPRAASPLTRREALAWLSSLPGYRLVEHVLQVPACDPRALGSLAELTARASCDGPKIARV